MEMFEQACMHILHMIPHVSKSIVLNCDSIHDICSFILMMKDILDPCMM